MKNYLFSIFPSENFIDFHLHQYGWEQCQPSHTFGPATEIITCSAMLFQAREYSD